MPPPTAHPPTEKKNKKALVKVTKVPTPTPSSPYTSASSAPDSSAYSFEGVSSSSRCDPSDPRACPFDPEPEPLALVVIDKRGVEKTDMSHDLRVSFGERHRKRLYEAIDIVLPWLRGLAWRGLERNPKGRFLQC